MLQTLRPGPLSCFLNRPLGIVPRCSPLDIVVGPGLPEHRNVRFAFETTAMKPGQFLDHPQSLIPLLTPLPSYY